MKNKRFYLGVSSVILSFLFLCFFLFYYTNKDSHQFDSLTHSLFINELEKDTLSLHYTLADPSYYDMDTVPVSFSCFDAADFQKEKQDITKYLNRLSKINVNCLSQTDAACYQNLAYHLSLQLKDYDFPYYAEPLSPNSGAQTQLPILLAEYRFETKSDIENYLTLLSMMDTYFQSLITYEKQKADLGLFMSDASMEKVIFQCDTLFSADGGTNNSALENDSHFLIKTFENRLDELVKEDTLTSSEACSYCARNKKILQHDVYPAYVSLGDELFLLKGSGKNENGLCYFSQGKSYYTHLVKSLTCSGKDITTLKNRLSSELHSIYTNYSKASKELSVLAENGKNCSPALPFQTSKEMLSDLEQKTKNNYPVLPASSSSIHCTIKKVDESLQDFVSPAFYLTPPIDNVSDNTIYINEKSPLEALELYTTLAHEGYPGHLYQSVYSLLWKQTNQHKAIDRVLYFGGYVEGWAYYVENLSYEYAKESLPENEEKELLSAYFEVCRLNRNLQICLYSLLDIAIHYDGMTYPEAKSVLNQFGIADEITTKNIYEYIVEEPANYLKYFIGYLEISECKQKAKELWGDNYTDLKFHTFFLESGPTSFPLLQEKLKSSTYRYLASAAIWS